MFKKFADRVTDAAAGLGGVLGVGGEREQKVRHLQGMGFDAARARGALDAADGDVDRAAELLLLSGGSDQPHQQERQSVPLRRSNTAPAGGGDGPDEQMRRAMEESRLDEEERQVRAAREGSAAAGGRKPAGKEEAAAAKGKGAAARDRPITNPAGLAAARRAEEARGKFGTGKGVKKKAKAPAAVAAVPAKARSFDSYVPGGGGGVRMKSNGLSHHPNVKVPAQMKDKTKEEQILRCADRLKPHPAAVDTLLRALAAVRDDPANDRYRKVDKTTAGYANTLEGRPGAEDMLLAMSFRRRGANELVLDRSMVDPALLYLGISALEGARTSEEYRENRRKEQFAREVRKIQLSANDSEAEAVRRAAFMAKCPSEPEGGRGALVQLTIADETVRRRFDGDDVLRDVLNWIGGHGSAIPEKITSREWCLVDLNRYPIVPIDAEKNMEKTLQFIGFWPSGKLEIRPSTDEWREGKDTGVVMGSSRGLGAAPTSELH